MPRMDAIGLLTSNLEASLDFYRRLGVDVPDEWERPHVEATLPGGIRLMWDDAGDERPSGDGQLVSLAFLCDSAAEVDAVYAALEGHGHTEPWDAEWGQRYAIVTDPDGNDVSLFAWLA